MTTEYKLRRYEHLGKFEGGLAIDEWAYNETLNGGADEEIGSVQECGWYGLLNGPFETVKSPGADLSSDTDLTDDERAYLASCAGCIICETDNGFVDVEWFPAGDGNRMDAVWSSVCEDLYPDEDDSVE